ncbi:MAG: sugar ABC transporter substrate-binding protein [Hydrogenibacillus sp.]|nr:sugar ABC transporter substrate-binding protein [Hydrogenibacillus sp.]
MRNRWAAALFLLSLLLVFASACGATADEKAGQAGEEPAQTNGQGSASGEKVTLRLLTWAGADESKELQEILDRLNAQSETYVIKQDSNPADYETRLITQLSGASGPDLFWVSAQRAAQLAAQGAMLDITDRLKASDHPAAKLDDYFEGSLKPFTREDRIYGLPWIEQPVMLYVNLDLFSQAGLEPPTTDWDWDRFVEAAKKLTVDQNGRRLGEPGFDEKKIKQWGFTVNGWPPVQMFVWQNGGDVIAPDFSSSPIDTPEATEAFDFYAELLRFPFTPSQSTIRDRGFDAMYRSQEVAMFMGGAADNLDYAVDFRSQAFPVPKGPDGIQATFGDILGMGISARTKHPDAAFQALLDLTDAIHHWKIMPPRKSLAEAETLKKLHPEKAHSLDAIIASMSFARPYRYFEHYADWDNIFWNELMDPIVNGRAAPSDLIPKVKPELDAVLQRAK